jgi:hypothetical protein
MERKDKIIEEIRKIREEHAAKFNYDLDVIYKDLKQKETQRGHKIVSLSSKPFFKATGS